MVPSLVRCAHGHDDDHRPLSLTTTFFHSRFVTAARASPAGRDAFSTWARAAHDDLVIQHGDEKKGSRAHAARHACSAVCDTTIDRYFLAPPAHCD